jgi:hypothetical protein
MYGHKDTIIFSITNIFFYIIEFHINKKKFLVINEKKILFFPFFSTIVF